MPTSTNKKVQIKTDKAISSRPIIKITGPIVIVKCRCKHKTAHRTTHKDSTIIETITTTEDPMLTTIKPMATLLTKTPETIGTTIVKTITGNRIRTTTAIGKTTTMATLTTSSTNSADND